MKAIVLVGGFGTRLRPLTLGTPKQMLPIIDRPMLEHVVAKLAGYGVDEVILSLGYRPDAFAEAYPSQTCAGVPLRYAVEPEPLDTAGAIGFAAREAAVNEPFFVLNGDVLTDADFGALWARHHEVDAQATIMLTPVEDPSRFGVVPTDDDGRVLGFVEKPEPGTAPTNWINAGTYVLDPSVVDLIPSDRRVSVERETFPQLVERGSLWAVQDDSYWIDAGTTEAYRQVHSDLISGRRATTWAAVAADAEVAADSSVVGSTIMRKARVDALARIERSVVMPGARIGHGAVVVDSIVGPGAQIGAGAQLLNDTVVGADEEIAPDSVLDGARVPES